VLRSSRRKQRETWSARHRPATCLATSALRWGGSLRLQEERVFSALCPRSPWIAPHHVHRLVSSLSAFLSSYHRSPCPGGASGSALPRGCGPQRLLWEAVWRVENQRCVRAKPPRSHSASCGSRPRFLPSPYLCRTGLSGAALPAAPSLSAGTERSSRLPLCEGCLLPRLLSNGAHRRAGSDQSAMKTSTPPRHATGPVGLTREETDRYWLSAKCAVCGTDVHVLARVCVSLLLSQSSIVAGGHSSRHLGSN